MSDNLFQVLGIQSREDCVSNAIAYAFNSCKKFREYFLRTICKKQPDDYKVLQAHTRVSIAGHGTPDLVLVCTSLTGTDLIVIENKLGAEEGEDQTIRYASEDFRELLCVRLCPDCRSPRWTLIFLTLFPDQGPASQEFTHRSYELLAGAASEYAHPDSLAESLVHDWLTLLDRFYKNQTVEPSDEVLEKLQDEDGLGGGYLYFREALRQLQLPPPLQIDWFFRSSQQGRRYYGAIISKDSWHPAEMVQHNSNLWNLDPTQNFHIHFEPQFDVLNHVFKLYLHYEVYPYQTKAWVRQHVPSNQFDEYIVRRTSFSDRLREKAPQSWKFGMGSNKIARADLDFAGKIFGSVRTLIETILKEMSAAIDESLQEIGCIAEANPASARS